MPSAPEWGAGGVAELGTLPDGARLGDLPAGEGLGCLANLIGLLGSACFCKHIALEYKNHFKGKTLVIVKGKSVPCHHFTYREAGQACV